MCKSELHDGAPTAPGGARFVTTTYEGRRMTVGEMKFVPMSFKFQPRTHHCASPGIEKLN
jgi:hypothetical protein